MTQAGHDDSLAEFLAQLRGEEAEPSTGGVGRFGATVRGAVGIASGVWSARRRAAKGTFGERDLRAAEALVRRLGDLKGLPMKMGQILGYLEADLPEELRRLLALLQTQSQPTPWASIEAILREELGERADALIAGLEREPVSSASIGQVHRGVLPGGQAVAVKVRHPGIDEAIRADFRGAVMGTTFARLMVPGAGSMARDFAKEAEARLLEECDYALEAERQQTFGTLFAFHPAVLVPGVHPAWSGPRVLTTEWQDGRDFDAFSAEASQAERDAAGAALFDVYVGTLYRHGLFHADPHPGNYRFRADGRVVVFDYGCTRVFDASSVRAFVALAGAVREGDDARMRAALAGLGAEPPRAGRAFERTRELLSGFFGPMLQPGAHPIDARLSFDARRITQDKLAIARMRLPAKLLFLFRIRVGLYSVLSRLGAVCDWSALERSYAEEAERAWVAPLPP